MHIYRAHSDGTGRFDLDGQEVIIVGGWWRITTRVRFADGTRLVVFSREVVTDAQVHGSVR